MADEEPATAEQIAEYESQLAGIVELLEASPGDESLLALKQDMEELLELSRSSMAEDTAAVAPVAVDPAAGTTEDLAPTTTAAVSEDLALPPPPMPPLPPPPPPPAGVPPETGTGVAGETTPAAGIAAQQLSSSSSSLFAGFHRQDTTASQNAASESATAKPSSKKEKPHKAKKSRTKQKKVKDFVLPDHLIPNDGDTDAERNKKRRAAKTLKNKWRLQKKEIESNNRQKSWQSFQNKSSKSSSSSSSSGSIFATKEGINDRVGVVSKKQLTEFGARKRHK
mmetsp:Transcript_5443/g.12502  ORF Transcript_5443/g.12502 Transcript_5443/m.12502 type:complete len:281 (-) Transcript_5443:465-1307(-)|eukprot:CAMPEP_0201130304 /NCGR_PEP_ID=MMETSP0850-20130426/39458_1 /ASSEMBLY_ACC=CAM_ASM_000622 /TAXON_ID=183588 /ORGANISM="Pseudo-nitzschia fraudulenta, Strain WWA7" /LENGTH=280 /DNA_ID=CAMNT_0047400043 /DNA_START=35 /DNA_END=877 /DNA_ORIENTATION=-